MTTPPAPDPDDKDWTWVLERPCPDCDYDASAITRGDIAPSARRFAATLAAASAASDGAQRPSPQVWSPLEYACHVRDVCQIFAERLRLMLDENDPQFPNWDQDVTALEEQYWAQDPAAVGASLTTSAEWIADGFAGVHDAQWDRPGRRSNGSVFTVDTLARYFLHDLAHHAWDVTGLR